MAEAPEGVFDDIAQRAIQAAEVAVIVTIKAEGESQVVVCTRDADRDVPPLLRSAMVDALRAATETVARGGGGGGS